MKEWYEQSFGDDYMIVYRHRDMQDAAIEIKSMIDWLKLPEKAEMLDIGCGMGRHSFALSKLGYKVTGVDLSEVLLKEAERRSHEKGIDWVYGDMRSLPFKEACFDATVNLFTSFGYFEREEHNKEVLRQIRKVLRPNGMFLLDFLNPTDIERNLVPYSERVDEETGLRIVEQRTIAEGWVQKIITLSDHLTGEDERQYLERVRLFPFSWFERNLDEAGLVLEQLYGDYTGSVYHAEESPRMIMAGRVRNL